MSFAYTLNDTATNIKVGKKYTSGSPNDTYDIWRGFLAFNTNTSTYTVGQITSVVLRINVESTSSVEIRVRSTKQGNADEWILMQDPEAAQLQLTAGDPDFSYVNNVLEDDVEVTDTGSCDFTINPTSLNLSGYTYFRLTKTNEGVDGNMVFSSQNNATASVRPQLIVTYTTAAGLQQAIFF